MPPGITHKSLTKPVLQQVWIATLVWQPHHCQSSMLNIFATQHLPKGMMDRYLPLNLLATVISCLRVQPRSEIAWCAAAGGWWLTCEAYNLTWNKNIIQGWQIVFLECHWFVIWILPHNYEPHIVLYKHLTQVRYEKNIWLLCTRA